MADDPRLKLDLRLGPADGPPDPALLDDLIRLIKQGVASAPKGAPGIADAAGYRKPDEDEQNRPLPRSADPAMALNHPDRLLAQPAARTQLPPLLGSRGRGLDAVLQLLAASQFFADTLAAYPEFLESVRTPPRKHPSTAELTAE